ncbi:MAG: hypothetical protein J6W19_02865 [Prevotella sp.]|nr:hypothetical protein [Prevotella sp.]
MKQYWHDDYWLLLMQLYLRKPTGVKPLYSRMLVDLSLELHISPQVLRARMQQLARLETPRIERLWKTYSNDPQRLKRAVRLLRNMRGFGDASQFYDGVEVQETFEKDFRPVVPSPASGKPTKDMPIEQRTTPAMLAMILNLYFQLTPSTMVSSTPEVKSLARLLDMKASEVVQVMDIYQTCDPYLSRNEMVISPLLLPCQQMWQRFGNHEPTELQTFAAELKEYFK